MCVWSQNWVGSRPLQTAARRWALAELFLGEVVKVLVEEGGGSPAGGKAGRGARLPCLGCWRYTGRGCGQEGGCRGHPLWAQQGLRVYRQWLHCQKPSKREL